jgi:hypothetical protein
MFRVFSEESLRDLIDFRAGRAVGSGRCRRQQRNERMVPNCEPER